MQQQQQRSISQETQRNHFNSNLNALVTIQDKINIFSKYIFQDSSTIHGLINI
jgi:hypothetical protein